MRTIKEGALQINFLWLLRLRWGAIAGQTLTIITVQWVMGIPLPLLPLAIIIGIEALSNLLCMTWARQESKIEEWMLVALMVADVLLLTALLYCTGGAFNPFSFLYLVHVALAAVVLDERWTWMLAATSLLGFGLLFVLPVWAPVDRSDSSMHGEHLRMHLEGMWVALGVASAFIVYFVQRVRHELAQSEAELAQAHDLRERNQKFASLVTLAGGAAHELATPLSTIAVVARELQRRSEKLDEGSRASEDASIIREQVDRCREILTQMTADAGGSFGESSVRVSIADLVREAVEETLAPAAVEIDFEASAQKKYVNLPPKAVVQALRNVIKNAQQASLTGQNVGVLVAVVDGRIHILVSDKGTGMSREVLSHLGEPFFTTKDPGEGMGLGLYLTRSVLTGIGGDLRFQSEPGEGTTATLELPVEKD